MWLCCGQGHSRRSGWEESALQIQPYHAVPQSAAIDLIGVYRMDMNNDRCVNIMLTVRADQAQSRWSGRRKKAVVITGPAEPCCSNWRTPCLFAHWGRGEREGEKKERTHLGAYLFAAGLVVLLRRRALLGVLLIVVWGIQHHSSASSPANDNTLCVCDGLRKAPVVRSNL